MKARAMTGHLRRLARDRAGAVSIFAAISFVALFGVAALAVDVGSFYLRKRQLQSAADLSSIAAASDATNARAAAVASLARNGFGADVLESIELGSYKSDLTVPSAARFTPDPSGGQAVRVTLKVLAPKLLSRIFSAVVAPARADTPVGLEVTNGSVVIRARAVAAVTTMASFAIGSRLLQLDGGIMNAVLGGLLGSKISLTAMDYQALANVQIDAFQFSKALATRAGLTAVTFGSLMSSDFRLPDILNATAQVANSNGSNVAAVALSQISNAISSAAMKLSLSKVFAFGPYSSLDISSSAPIGMSISALDLLTAVAKIGGTQHLVSASLTPTVPGILSAQMQVSIGEQPVGTSLVTLGSAGATVRTAQTRVLLTIGISGSPLAPLINVPVYLDIASGAAALKTVACVSRDQTSSLVTLNVSPGVVDAWIGKVSSANFVGTAPLSPDPAVLLNVAGLATVTGFAHGSIANVNPTSVTFGWPDISVAKRKSTSTTDFTASLVSSLLSTLSLNVSAAGVGLGIGGLDSSVAQLLATSAPQIDIVINAALSALGINLGQADTWVSGVRCNAAALVN